MKSLKETMNHEIYSFSHQEKFSWGGHLSATMNRVTAPKQMPSWANSHKYLGVFYHLKNSFRLQTLKCPPKVKRLILPSTGHSGWPEVSEIIFSIKNNNFCKVHNTRQIPPCKFIQKSILQIAFHHVTLSHPPIQYRRLHIVILRLKN